MPTFNVLVPFAGHIEVTVEAESKDQAITAAIGAATLDDVESWEVLERFIQGNVCYCPSPWEAKAEMEDED